MKKGIPPREADRRRRVDALQAGIVRGLAGHRLADHRRVLAPGAEVDGPLPDGLLAAGDRDAGQRPGDGGVVGIEEVLAAVEPARHAVRAPVAADAPRETALAPRGVVDVGVVGALDRDVGEVVHPQPAAQPVGQVLGQVRAGVEAAAPRHLDRAPAPVRRRRRPLVQDVEARVAGRGPRPDVAVLRAEPVARLGEPVVVERRVLAPAHRPEERVADRVPLERRRGVHREQEARGPILLVDRVVHDREVEQRHALHPHHGVLQHRVVIDVQDRGPRRDLPPRLRLHAGGEAAVGDPVLLLRDLLERLAVEQDLRLLRPEGALLRRPLRLLLQRRAA